jgi:hypothetical protein
MSIFDYLSVLFSVILGLAVTQILLGLRALMLARSRVAVYWPALSWAILLILIVAEAWWGMFAMRTFTQWTFAMFAVVLLQTTLIYLVAGLALPDIPPDGAVDMRRMYYDHAGWFFALFAATVVTTLAKDLITTGHFSSPSNAGLLGMYLLLSVVAAITRRSWFHALLAPFSVAVIIIYSALLSFRP